MPTFIEARLKDFIEHVREDAPSGGQWVLPDSDRIPYGEPPLVVSLARFQSYRARTEAALVEELLDYVETGNLGVINFKVLDIDQVLIW